MQHNYRFVILTGNIHKIAENIDIQRVDSHSNLNSIRIRPKTSMLYMYHYFNINIYKEAWKKDQQHRDMHYIIEVTKEEEDRITTLLVLGLELFNILKDMYGVFPLNGYVNE